MLIQFFRELRLRNKLLHNFGWLCLMATFVCLLLIAVTDRQILGVNAFIKPAKFFISVVPFAWTMGWILIHLRAPRAVRQFSVGAILILSFELLAIFVQAARGRLSHFNESTLPEYLLFQLMGLAIVSLVVWTAVLTIRFFRRNKANLPSGYLWGIRLGLSFFVIFALEGGAMAAQMAHSVGGADGSPGLPFVNWNRRLGDLRVAHFFGIHSLQILPLIGWWLRENSRLVIAISIAYSLFITYELVRALEGLPFI